MQEYGIAPSRVAPQPTDAGHDLPTLSIALPGSIVENTQSFELATALAGQIARAAAVFRVDEIVVFEVCVCPMCCCVLGCDPLPPRDEAADRCRASECP